MKKANIFTLSFISLSLAAVFFIGCSQENKTSENKNTESQPAATNTEAPAAEAPVADEGKGIGEIKHVDLGPLDEQMVKRGQSIYDMKCSACHKLDETKVVGPGWKGVTERRKPEWIMNFVTNTEMMLDKDPAAQKLLEECLTRMPNQGLAIGDARDVLELMRKNDGQK